MIFNGGASSYGASLTYPTTIGSSGILQLGDGSNDASITGNILNNGTLTFNNFNPATYAGNINGSGAVNVNGSGLLVLTGSSNYSNGTTISSGGTLQLGNGASNGSVAGNINNNSTLVFNNGAAQAYAGVISGNGNFVKTGPGTLSLTSASGQQYTGNTTINAGVLKIGNTSGSATGTGNVLVTSAGTLSGPGIIVPGSGNALTIDTGGAVAPAPNASAFGTLTVSGDLQFNTASALNLNFGVADGSHNDMVLASGNLTFNSSPAVTINAAFPGGLKAGTYEILGDGSTITGSPAWTVNIPSLLAYQVLAPGAGSPYANAYALQTTFQTATWTGSQSNAWDTTAPNWYSLISAASTTYTAGQAVVFADSAASTGAKNSNILVNGSGVSPASVTFTNNSLAYSFSNASGALGIAGLTDTVTLNGSGTVTFQSPNTYVGGTFLNAGTLVVSADNQFGTVPGLRPPT